MTPKTITIVVIWASQCLSIDSFAPSHHRIDNSRSCLSQSQSQSQQQWLLPATTLQKRCVPSSSPPIHQLNVFVNSDNIIIINSNSNDKDKDNQNADSSIQAIGVFTTHNIPAIDQEINIVVSQPTMPSGQLQLQLQRQQQVPRTMKDAIRVFFFTGDFGPTIAAITIAAFLAARFHLAGYFFAATTLSAHQIIVPVTGIDAIAFSGSIFFWWIQEHILHKHILHSKVDWVGKQIHQGHHDLPYHHISIDPAWMLLSWLFIAHIILRCTLPLPLALTATIGYAFAGLFYEWAHFIVHTKVPLSSSKFWSQVRNNHVRHHRVDSNNWFAFSLPLIDDLFGTNPPLARIIQQNRNKDV